MHAGVTDEAMATLSRQSRLEHLHLQFGYLRFTQVEARARFLETLEHIRELPNLIEMSVSAESETEAVCVYVALECARLERLR
jgi:hypothetical protein